MLRSSGAIVVAFLLSHTTVAAEAVLSGSWSPSDYQQTKHPKQTDPKAPPAPPAPPEGKPQLPLLRIAHQGTAVVIELIGDGGSVLSTRRLTTDGAENVNKLEGGLAQRSRSRWDGTALTTKWRLVRSGRTVMTGVEVLTLSDDRSTLTQSSALEDAKSRTETRTVYRRK